MASDKRHKHSPYRRVENLLTHVLTGHNTTKASALSIWLGLTTLIIGHNESDLSTFRQIRRLASVRYSSNQLNVIKRTFTAFVKADDRYDSMDPETILSYGPRPEPSRKELSSFAKNFLTEEEIGAFYTMEKMGVATHEEVTLHLNIITGLMWDEAEQARRFHETGSQESREKMRDAHIQMTQFIYYTFSMILNPQRNAYRSHEISSCDDLQKAYPLSADMGRITQLYDDVFDTLRDLNEEIAYKRPSGNAVLAAVHRKHGLLNQSDKDAGGKNLNDSLLEFYKKQLGKKRPIELFSLPPQLKEGIAEVRTEYMDTLARMDMPEIAKAVFRASFESMLKEGINPPVKQSHSGKKTTSNVRT